MQNDSIETLLLRHYGSAAPTPVGLEARLVASLQRREADAVEQRIVTLLAQRRISRRHATRLMALGAAGVGVLSLGLEGLQAFEAALAARQDAPHPAYS